MPASADAGFMPEQAQEGALYPVDGGMVAGIKANCTIHDARFMVFSGIATIGEALKDIDLMETHAPLFIEVLACTGGCVNGPKALRRKSTLRKRQEIIDSAPYHAEAIPRRPSIAIETSWAIAPVAVPLYSEVDIRSALKRVGKVSLQDELNCSSCGYDSCRGFAVALLDGRAEPSMCAGYMRKLAGKKADALIRTMPAGIVIVDHTMRIIECNRRFAELLGADALERYDAGGGLDGVEMREISSIQWLFMRALSQQMESVETDVKLRDSVLHATVFTIEQEHLAGGIFQDITAPAVQKERIITKAKEVIAKNIATVQQIAYLLGENAADSEVILNSIVSSFAPESIEADKKHDK
jgi:PAS domain-containing protein